MSSTQPGHDGSDVRRIVEYYDSTVQLTATMIVREADGWDLLSAGRVDDNKFWAEYERISPGDGTAA